MRDSQIAPRNIQCACTHLRINHLIHAIQGKHTLRVATVEHAVNGHQAGERHGRIAAHGPAVGAGRPGLAKVARLLHLVKQRNRIAHAATGYQAPFHLVSKAHHLHHPRTSQAFHLHHLAKCKRIKHQRSGTGAALHSLTKCCSIFQALSHAALRPIQQCKAIFNKLANAPAAHELVAQAQAIAHRRGKAAVLHLVAQHQRVCCTLLVGVAHSVAQAQCLNHLLTALDPMAHFITKAGAFRAGAQGAVLHLFGQRNAATIHTLTHGMAHGIAHAQRVLGAAALLAKKGINQSQRVVHVVTVVTH